MAKELSGAVRDRLQRIDRMLARKGAHDRAFYCRIGQLWFEVKNDDDVQRGELKKLAPDFHHEPDFLQRCVRLYTTQHILPHADDWASRTHFQNPYPLEPFRSLHLLNVFAKAPASPVRSDKDSNRLARTDQTEDETETGAVIILAGDCRVIILGLPDQAFNCVLTSPPYYRQRQYGDDPAEMGNEASVADYVFELVKLYRQVRRVLRDDGVAWIVINDRWASGPLKAGNALTGWAKHPSPPREADAVPAKSLLLIPDRLCIALQNDGWLISAKIIWRKSDGNNESVKDRPTPKYEAIIMMTKSPRYWYNADLREPAQPEHRPGPKDRRKGRLRIDRDSKNTSDVWDIAPETHVPEHPAAFPLALARRMLLLSCPPAGHALDPFGGSGTVGVVARSLGMRATLIELDPAFARRAAARNATVPDATAEPPSRHRQPGDSSGAKRWLEIAARMSGNADQTSRRTR